MTLTAEIASEEGLRALFALRPGVLFFNHGSYGACPREVLESYHQMQWRFEEQPVEFVDRTLSRSLAETRAQVAPYLGAAPDDIVFAPNSTNALRIMTRRLALQPGDEVLTSDHEYHTMEAYWSWLCEVRGARYVHQHVPLPVDSPEAIVEALWAGVTPRTRVLFFSHITSPSALTMPLELLVARARAHGILTIVDGAHAPGQRPLALHASGVDVYMASCHKWMLAPRGSGFLYVRREMQPLLWGEPPLAEGATPKHSLAELQWQGTRDLSSYLSIPAAIEFMARHNWPTQQARCHGLVQYARERLAAFTGLPQVTPDSPAWYAQMAPLPLPRCDSGYLLQQLRQVWNIEVPITGYNGQQFLRLSVQAYNTRAEVDTLLEAVTTTLPEAVRRAEAKG
ncbi:MAG: aminotransferase class V-fold PLP-dependent enzyme [Chloroflexi bacterium]|nr:aminotransferase class V-fold PLP-dependent enzyme [Chloroflexota bacterium]